MFKLDSDLDVPMKTEAPTNPAPFGLLERLVRFCGGLAREFYCSRGWHGWRWTLPEDGYLSLNGPPPDHATCEYCGIRYKKI